MLAVLRIQAGCFEYHPYEGVRWLIRAGHLVADPETPYCSAPTVQPPAAAEHLETVPGSPAESDFSDSLSDASLDVSEWGTGPRQPAAKLASVASPRLLHRFVRLAHNIHVLSHTMIEQCLQTCKASQPFPWSSPDKPDQVLGHPTWTEEQRAILAIWRLQFYYELKLAQIGRRLDWRESDLRRLQSDTLDSFYRPGMALQQALTARDFVRDLKACSAGHSTQEFELPISAEGTEFMCLCQPQPFRPGCPDRLPGDRRIFSRLPYGPRYGPPSIVIGFDGTAPGTEWEDFEEDTRLEILLYSP